MQRTLLLAITLSSACGGTSARPQAPALPHEPTTVSIGGAAAQGGLPSLSHSAREEAPGVAASLRAELLDPETAGKLKLDGLLNEWPPRARADTVVQGAAERPLAFAMAVRYDATTLYVGGEVTTASFRRTPQLAESEDHASLILAFGAAVYEIELFAGQPGKLPGEVRIKNRKGAIHGSEIVEASVDGGYSFEASLPWATFPEASTVRVGLRGVGRYYEGARIVATGTGDAHHVDDLPPLPIEAELALDEGFLGERNLRAARPSFDLLADVSGDAMKERIRVWGNLLTVVGPGYRDGRGFYYRDLGAPLARIEARPLTGRRKDDLVIVRRIAEGGTIRERFEVLSFLAHEEPTMTFGHEIAVVEGSRRVDDSVHAGPRGIEVSTLPGHGWDASTYAVATTSDPLPILLPWGPVKSETFRFDGATFTKSSETPQR